MMPYSCKYFKSVLLTHQFEYRHSLINEIRVMNEAIHFLLLVICFKKHLLGKDADIVSWNRSYMFESVDKHVRVIDIYSIHESFFLIFIFRNKVIYIDSTVCLSTTAIVLQFIRMTQPFLNSMLIDIEI